LQRLIINQIADVEALKVLDVSKGESNILDLNNEMVNEFSRIEGVEKVSPSLSLSAQVLKDEAVTDVAVYGINPESLSIEGVDVSFGEGFSSRKAKEMIITDTALNLIGIDKVQEVLNSDLKLKLMVPQKIKGSEEEELVSKEIMMKVKGILHDEESLSIAYVPLGFLEDLGIKVSKEKGREIHSYSAVKVKVTDQEKLPAVRERIEELGYQVDSVADTVGQIDKIFLIFEIVVGGFGAIAMFVAAMGALNTLTVSLLERTREIGLMKALGATSKDIYRLFIVEAVLIGVSGGILGIFVGVSAGEIVNAGLNYMASRVGGKPVDIFYTPLLFILVILIIIFLVSLITGVYPAKRAAKISPLDALRYE